MGYQVTFIPTEEKMKSYAPDTDLKDLDFLIESEELEILCYCMKDHSGENAKLIINKLKIHLQFLMHLIEDREKSNVYSEWKNNSDHTIQFTGWEMASESDFTRENSFSAALRNLLMLAAIVKTPDYFDDNEKFYNKSNQIRQEVTYFDEAISDIVQHEIIDDLDEFKQKNDYE